MIGNLVLADFDKEMASYADVRGFKFTRYADDITISSREWLDEQVLEDVRQCVDRFGFKLNDRKTRFMGPGDRQEVTGIVLNVSPNLPRDWRNSVRGYLHRVMLRPRHYIDDLAKVRGLLGALLAVDPEAKRKITRMAREAVHLLEMENLLG